MPYRNDSALVRILAPSNGNPVLGFNGQPPEYVRIAEENGVKKQVAADPHRDFRENKITGFYARARFDFEVVLDEQIIDMNSLQLPRDLTVRDERESKSAR